MGTILGTTTYFEDLPPLIQVHGDKGGVITEGDKITFWKVAEEEKSSLNEDSFLRNAVEDTSIAIKEDRKPWVNGEEGRKSLEVIMAIYESSRKGKAVEFSD